jgi:hypothetical protein
MLDVFNIPGQQDNVTIFYGRGTTDWQTWQKPRNCKFIWIMCIGGGCGGEAGTTESPSNVGGRGGGSGGVCRVIYPANVLPDTLFVQPGAGSAGAAFPGTPSPASRSFVGIIAGTAAMNTVCVSGAAGAGTTNPNNAETAATTTQAGLMSLGTFIATAGQAGDTLGSGITPLSATITSGGALGGIVTVAGGTPGLSIASVNLGIYTTPQISGGAAGGISGTGGAGNNGIWSWKPMFGLGGAGGGGTNTGVNSGGRGGDGAYGCGGGGGAAGSTIGGAGGKGGDGLVIIATF